MRTRPPPLPSLISGGLWNTSSSRSAPLCAFATETVCCNDMRACPPAVLSLTCAHCSTLIRDDDQDGFRKRQQVKSGLLPTGALVPRD